MAAENPIAALSLMISSQAYTVPQLFRSCGVWNYASNFGGALAALRSGHKIARKGWNAHHSRGLQTLDEQSANTLPYIFMVVGTDATDLQGKRVPWVASQSDRAH